MAILEIACFNPEDAILAYEAGADRIELCDDREAGGTTPHPQWLSTVKARVNIPVYVMIRPRGGDFVYSPAEFDQMGAEIDSFKPHANGYVFGILDHECRVDIARTAELVQRAHPLPCTFHRGFDETRDPFEAFEDVISSGCKAILSSGGAPSAHAGINILNQLVRMSLSRITVMPGGSVRANNVAAIRGFTGATVFHSSARLRGMSEPDAHEIRQMKLLLQQNILQPGHSPNPASPETERSINEEEPLWETQTRIETAVYDSRAENNMMATVVSDKSGSY